MGLLNPGTIESVNHYFILWYECVKKKNVLVINFWYKRDYRTNSNLIFGWVARRTPAFGSTTPQPTWKKRQPSYQQIIADYQSKKLRLSVYLNNWFIKGDGKKIKRKEGLTEA